MSKHIPNHDPVQELLRRLEGVKKAGADKWQAFCPLHENPPDGHKRSLSVGRGTDGRALIHCKACGKAASKAILAVIDLSLADLYPAQDRTSKRARLAPSAQKQKGPTIYNSHEDAIAAAARMARGQFAAEWKYPGDAFRVARFALPDGDKSFRPIHRNGRGWIVGDPTGPLPLYRGDELPETGPIILVEGERCADDTRSVDFAAVTSAHGAGAAHKSDWLPLAGREVERD